MYTLSFIANNAHTISYLCNMLVLKEIGEKNKILLLSIVNKKGATPEVKPPVAPIHYSFCRNINDTTLSSKMLSFPFSLRR